MYPIALDSLLDQKEYLKEPILFFSCISFEERSKTAAIKIFEAFHNRVIWRFFQLRDNGSYYEKDCCIKQNEIKATIDEIITGDKDFKEYYLFESTPWNDIIFYFDETIKKQPSIKTLILDITTIPKTCYFAFLKWLLDGGLEKRDLIICYTKPQEYGNSSLSSDPTSPKLLIGDFNEFNEILWIPLLGFKPTFTETIMEKIKEINLETQMKIIPMIGFPPYRPDYFDKCLILHAKIRSPELTEALKYPSLAAADDPFDVYKKLMKIFENSQNKKIILSPLGSKPMSLGMALAAIQENIPVYSIQPRTYHPDYSKGEGETSAYWIIRDGEYTYK